MIKMTDEEYTALLRALAAKHLRPLTVDSDNAAFTWDGLQRSIAESSATARLLKVVIDTHGSDFGRNHCTPALCDALIGEASPVRQTKRYMEESGILDALDDAPAIVFGEFRRTAVPKEDVEVLQRAGYTPAEIEILFITAVEEARLLASQMNTAHKVMENAAVQLEQAATTLKNDALQAAAPTIQPPKKRKLFNGIGKILAGAIAGATNVLLATGTLVAPNPATAHIALGSGALAVSSTFGGIGDLLGE